jgi:mannitol 2-dehydrogenase
MTVPVHSTPLTAATLAEIGQRIAVPAYDRSRVEPGIVHVGVGAFHRSHQAMYLDRLLNNGEAFEWGICGVGLLPSDEALGAALARQDHLYTLVVKEPDGAFDSRVIGSLVDYLFAPDDPESVLEMMCRPSTRMVSLTITEGGYNIDEVTGAFDGANTAVVSDLRGGAVPVTVFGYVIEALQRRRARSVQPFTVVSCDNIQGNGDVARSSFSTFAELKEPGLGDWIREHVAFPNSMVDRITPATSDADIDALRERVGIEDACPVVCEPFVQWVVEDTFPSGRPPLDRSGVQLTDDVEPYELMKLRILNAGHQAIAYTGILVGFTYAHEAASDPAFVTFLRDYMNREARPTLNPVPGIDLDEYVETVLQRFASPAIRDTLARLAAFTSDRIPKFVLPVIRHNLATGGEITRSVAVVASWARYAEGSDEAGEPIEVVDRLRDEVVARARMERSDPLAFVRNERLFGDLAEHPVFADTYLQMLGSLRLRGVRATLEMLAQAPS